MLSVRLSALASLYLLSSCATVPTASHGPISDRLQRQLEKNAVTKGDLIEQLKTGQMHVDLRPGRENVTIPFRLENATPTVKVAVNGSTGVPMQLDTGAARSMIGASTAVANHVTLLRAEDASVELRGVIGAEQGRVGILTPLQIGSWQLSGYPCVVRTHDNVIHSGFGSQTFSSDIIGFDLAQRYASYLTLDFRGGKATYGFSGTFTAPRGLRVAKSAMHIRQGVPFITLKSGGKSWEALVDTGSFNGIELSTKVAAQLGLANKGETVKDLYLMSVGGSVSAAEVGLKTVTLPDLTAFGDTYRQVQASVSPGVPRVGSLFLRDYRVTFDFRRALIWLEW